MRLRHIDFLRGIAVILVLLRHHAFINNTHNPGWIGVDLFFVLSGFLVSGLLFREYIQEKKVNAKLFLIRRGFKIYPLFYLALLATIIIELSLGHKIARRPVISEMLFLQNYYLAIWNHTWSLAVEEHFYLLVAMLITFLARTRKLHSVKLCTCVFFVIGLMCLGFRIYNNLYVPFDYPSHIFRTHLRMDSLLFGVALSYYHSFRKEMFASFFQRKRLGLYMLSLVLILPALVINQTDAFVNTIGLTFLYVGFGILLANFVTDKAINEKIDKLFSRRLVNFTSIVGVCSYAIYLFHMFVHRYIASYIKPLWLSFFIYFFGSVLLGILISKTIEVVVLRYRDRWFPKKGHEVKNLNIAPVRLL
jgi:peptidoglycan/LPS O-acetylase OafA/YrhL